MNAFRDWLNGIARVGLIVSFITGCSTSMPSEGPESNEGAGGTGGEDTQTGTCDKGETRCTEGDLIERCENGSWTGWEDCAAQDKRCGLQDGDHVCLSVEDSASPIDTATESADDTESDTATHRDTETDWPTDSETTSFSDGCAGTDPCGDHGTCEDTNNGVRCVCDAGWAGEGCDSCAPGFHDEDGWCVLDQTCLSNTCSGHGTCEVVDGVVACTCTADANWDPDTFCAACLEGYHPNGDTCVQDETCGADDEPCINGTCDVVDGVVECSCGGLWTGDRCDTCPAGHHENAGGTDCVLDETCLPNSCAGHGTCDVVDGIVACTCAPDANWDPDTFCASCLDGFHPDGDGCVADETCGADDEPCVNGTCGVVDGVVECSCGGLWTGDRCDTCPAGHHENTSGTACVLDETCLPNTCSGHGTCEVVGGVVGCTCAADANWDPATYCSECVAGYHPDGDVCIPDEACGADDEPCVNGACEVVDGVVECGCGGLWTGDLCNICPAGYHVEGTSCVKDLNCTDDNTCVNGTCGDLGGIITCTCDPGWGGAICGTCAPGYHLNPAGDACELDETCIDTSCAGNGECAINEYGYVECTCEAGGHWNSDVYCAECVAGYHDDNGVCVADRSCAEDDNCVSGTCVDNLDGTDFTCSCDPYWTGDRCTSCVEGFQDDDDDGVCRPACGYTGAPNCQNGGVCQVNLTTGYAECDCTSAAPWEGPRCDQCPNETCDGACCADGQRCHASTGACCTPSTCDTFSGAPECGESTTLDACGLAVDCGDCGSYGYCDSGTCQCLHEYGVPDGEHECVHACDGFLPSVGCCDDDIVYYCNGSKLQYVDCYDEYSHLGDPWDTCGYINTASGGPDFNCGGDDTLETGYTPTCPANVLLQCEDDSSEPNDDLASAAAIAVDVLERGLQICPGDADWYELVGLNPGDEITVDVEFLHDAGNIDVYLYDSGETELTAATSATNNETLSYTIADAGDYYIRVAGFSGSVENSYTLLVTGNLACVNDAFDTDGTDNDAHARADALTSGVSVSDLVICDGETTGDVDWFSIGSAGAGDTVSAFVSFSHGAGDLNLYLYNDPDGAPLLSRESTTDNESLVFVADATYNGTFYLKVQGIDETVRNSYDISASIGACTDPYETNDNSTQASSASSGVTVDNGYVCPNDVDWFEISSEVLHGQEIQLDANFDGDGDLDLSLYYDDNGTLEPVATGTPDATGKVIAFTAGALAGGVQTTKGTYYFTLEEATAGADENDYSVDVQVTGTCSDRLGDNHTDTNATVLTSGQTENGLYICPEEYDFFRIEDVQAGSNISVTVTFSDPHGAPLTTDLDVLLFHTSYVLWDNFVDASFSDTSNEQITASNVPVTADYIILVSGDEYGDADFSLQENLYGISVTVTGP